MQDVYLMNNDTGELIPSEQVFREFYKTHKWNESVFDYFTETEITVDNSEIANPFELFANCINV